MRQIFCSVIFSFLSDAISFSTNHPQIFCGIVSQMFVDVSLVQKNYAALVCNMRH